MQATLKKDPPKRKTKDLALLNLPSKGAIPSDCKPQSALEKRAAKTHSHSIA